MVVTPKGGGSIAPSLLADTHGGSQEDARRNRVALLARMHEFERAIAVPAEDSRWRRRVESSLARLREAFADHVAVTEGATGLYAELLIAAPRLARAVTVLVREHTMLTRAFGVFAGRLREPETEVARLRWWAGDLLHELSRHRQRGAELIYEAYATDIGGET